ncbi:MAG: hypothetical protein KGJ55_04740 [Gammaproteobacteria bacterium]|nr:hypothetical protein [Gammaproteobacteria bacterium]
MIDMNDVQLTTLDQVREFLAGTAALQFSPLSDDATRYRFVAAVVARFDYRHLGRADKGLLRHDLIRTTGYSRTQVARLIRQCRETGRAVQRYAPPKAGFTRRYTEADARLLAQVDGLHGTLSGPATRVLLQRAYRVYADARFERLAGIAVAHLYNLRRRAGYLSVRRVWTVTRPTPVTIGQRRRPEPAGRPGFIRVDSVHQGDQDGIKGLCAA